MSFGERLTSLRKKNGITQEQLAEKVGVTRQTISKWELDQSAPDLNYVSLLSGIFDVTTDFLIKGEMLREDEVEVTIAEGYSEIKEDIIENEIKPKRIISGIAIVGILIVISGVILVMMSIGQVMNMLDGDLPYIIMVLLWGVSIMLTGVELILVKKYPRMGCLCVILSVVAMILFSYVVPTIANVLEIRRIESQTVTVPGSLGVRRIYGFDFAIYNITYIVNCIIVMIQGLIIGFKKHNLYNIILSVVASVFMLYVILFGQWYEFSNIILGLIFLGVSVFLTVNYYADKKLS